MIFLVRRNVYFCRKQVGNPLCEETVLTKNLKKLSRGKERIDKLADNGKKPETRDMRQCMLIPSYIPTTMYE
jgi:hypothetical protein